MLSKAIKFLSVISNELSYAQQVTNQWSELEQVANALSNAVESRNEYKEKYESEQAYINYLQGAYRSASDQRTELETENEELREQIKILLAENEKLKNWDIAYQSLLKDYYEIFDKQREFKRIFTLVIAPLRA